MKLNPIWAYFDELGVEGWTLCLGNVCAVVQAVRFDEQGVFAWRVTNDCKAIGGGACSSLDAALDIAYKQALAAHIGEPSVHPGIAQLKDFGKAMANVFPKISFVPCARADETIRLTPEAVAHLGLSDNSPAYVCVTGKPGEVRILTNDALCAALGWEDTDGPAPVSEVEAPKSLLCPPNCLSLREIRTQDAHECMQFSPPARLHRIDDGKNHPNSVKRHSLCQGPAFLADVAK